MTHIFIDEAAELKVNHYRGAAADTLFGQWTPAGDQQLCCGHYMKFRHTSVV